MWMDKKQYISSYRVTIYIYIYVETEMEDFLSLKIF